MSSRCRSLPLKKLLDSSTCIALLRGKHKTVTDRFLASDSADLHLCSIVVAELQVGALRAEDPVKEGAKVRSFTGGFPVIPFGLAEAEVYAKVRYDLERTGMKIGANDLIIAATALVGDLVLVTHNTAEFARVQGLHLEDWQT